MPFVLTVPNEYGYVILAATSTFILNLAHTQNTGTYRKPACIEYPNAYATPQQAKEDPKAFAFNCAQRSHANFTEHHASAVAALLIAGLRFPLAASACGLGWTIARAAYMVGYSTSKPETKGRGRYKGAAFWAFELALIGMAGYTGVQMLLN